MSANESGVAMASLSDDDIDSLMKQLRIIDEHLSDTKNTELCINRPHELWTETSEGWTRHLIEDITYNWCLNLAKLIANRTEQSMRNSPLLGATLPTGERIQIAVPPAVKQGTVSITIRKPGSTVKEFNEFVAEGAFEKTRIVQQYALTEEERTRIEADLADEEIELLKLLRGREFEDFFKLAIQEKKTIVISGSTGAGKTTLANSLLEFIPKDERILTVEDTPEAKLPEDMNAVNMFYSKGDQGTMRLTPKDIFECNLRQRPDRVLPAELRGDETFFFVQNVLNSGHGGSLTTLHSNSTKLAFLRLSLMIKSSPEGKGLDRHDILEMLYQLIDIVIQIRVVKVNGKKKRVITEIYYDPAFARKQMG